MGKALYPGTFDPITYGHRHLTRAAELCDEVIVGVAIDNNKSPLFTLEERIQLIKKATAHLTNVSVKGFAGLTIDFARQCGVHTIVRGLRVIADFEYEMQMALMNKELAPDIETVFLMTQSKYSFISSSAVKQAAALQADISKFVPPHVKEALFKKYFKLNDSRLVSKRPANM